MSDRKPELHTPVKKISEYTPHPPTPPVCVGGWWVVVGGGDGGGGGGGGHFCKGWFTDFHRFCKSVLKNARHTSDSIIISVNSLALGEFEWNFRYVIFKQI